MTITEVLGRIDSMVTGAPFQYRPAREPFSFDLQPSQLLDRTYCLTADPPRDIAEYFGFAQAELTPVTIRLARKVARDATATYRTLLTDATSLASVLAHDPGDCNIHVESFNVPAPGPDDDFVIAELIALTDYEREL